MTNGGNLFTCIPAEMPEEISDLLAVGDGVRIERILSKGHASPPGFWYDQTEHEWVLLMQGEARLRFKDGKSMHLTSGTYVHIPAHTKHRVEWTTEAGETIWLAVFYRQ